MVIMNFQFYMQVISIYKNFFLKGNICRKIVVDVKKKKKKEYLDII